MPVMVTGLWTGSRCPSLFQEGVPLTPLVVHWTRDQGAQGSLSIWKGDPVLMSSHSSLPFFGWAGRDGEMGWMCFIQCNLYGFLVK